MGDIVNLNKYRKGQERAGRRQLAAVNRQKFARPKAELVRLEAERTRAAEALDGHAPGHAQGGGAPALNRDLDRAPEDQAPDESDTHPSADPHPDRPGAPRETD